MKSDPLTVAEYMTREPQAIDPVASLPSALKVMRTHGIRHLPVTIRDELVGVLSTRDLNLVTTLAQAPPDAITVEDVMSREPYTVTPRTPLYKVARAMAERRIGSAIIVDGGRVVGVFTTVDALRALTDLLKAQKKPSAHGNGKRRRVATPCKDAAQDKRRPTRRA